MKAEGTMNETVIPSVTKALEETWGITNIQVQVLEGIASVEIWIAKAEHDELCSSIVHRKCFKLLYKDTNDDEKKVFPNTTTGTDRQPFIPTLFFSIFINLMLGW